MRSANGTGLLLSITQKPSLRFLASMKMLLAWDAILERSIKIFHRHATNVTQFKTCMSAVLVKNAGHAIQQMVGRTPSLTTEKIPGFRFLERTQMPLAKTAIVAPSPQNCRWHALIAMKNRMFIGLRSGRIALIVTMKLPGATMSDLIMASANFHWLACMW